MKRTTVMAAEETLERIQQIAQRRGVSSGVVIREALDEKVERERPLPRFWEHAVDAPARWPGAQQFDEDDLWRPDP